jgi:ADP-ribose pyrophosphatase
MAHPDWTLRESVVDHETDFFTVGHDVLERPDWTTTDYHWVDRDDVVAVVALDERDGPDDLVLVEQYRQRFDTTTLECPAGIVDPGESFTDAAVRELREETGYTAGSVELLDTCRPTAWTKHEQGIVLATDLTPGEQALEAGEHLTVEPVPVPDAHEAISARGPLTAWTLSALSVARAADAV